MRILIFFLFSLSCKFVHALDPTHFTITRVTAPYFIVDANSPTTITTAYVGFEVKNISVTTYNALILSVPSIGSSVSGQNYTVVSPVSKQVVVGTLAPGQSKTCYFYVTYPANVTPVASFNLRLSDLTPTAKDQVISIYNRSSISANAGGIATQSFANQDALGAVIIDTVTYTVGNVRNGDESDFQVAVSNQFDPTKMELLSTQVVQSNVPGIPNGTTDSLYFITGNGSSGAAIRVVWRFRIKAFNFTNFLLPCAGSTSGASNYKYALDNSISNGVPVTVSTPTNPMTLTKTSNKTNYSVCEQATFTIQVNNPGVFDVSVDSLKDALPTGFTYESLTVSSGISTTNSVEYPSSGATSSLKYTGGVNAGSIISYLVPAGGAIQLIYTATAPCYSISNLTTTARGFIGSTEFDNDQNTVNVLATVPVSWLSLDVRSYNSGHQLTWLVDESDPGTVYDVQHSKDGMNWRTVGKVNGHSGSGQPNTYQFIYRHNSAGKNYYRIISMDSKGDRSISKIVVAGEDKAMPQIRIISNPVYTGVMHLQLSDAGSIALINGFGQMVWSKYLHAGYQQIQCQHMPKGLYWLKSANSHVPVIIQ